MPKPGFLHLRSAIGGPRTPLGAGELMRHDLASSADWPGVDCRHPYRRLLCPADTKNLASLDYRGIARSAGD